MIAPAPVEQDRAELVALLDTVIGTAPVGIAVFDSSLRFVRVNEVACQVDGIPAEQHLGRTVLELFPAFGPTIHAKLEQVLATGRALSGLELSGETPAAPGQQRHWLANYYPVRTHDGQVWGVAALALEITERKRTELNARFLVELDQDIAQTAEADEIVSRVLRRLADYLAASRCSLNEIELAAALSTIRQRWTTGSPDLAATSPLASVMQPALRAALEAGEAVGINDVQRDPRTASFAEIYAARKAAAFAIASYVRDGQLVAALTAVSAEQRDWRADEVELLRSVIARLWPAVERARAGAAQREQEARLRLMSHRLQTALLVTRINAFDQDRDLRYTWAYNPAFGYVEQEVLGKRDSDLLERPEDAAALESLKRAVLASGQGTRQEVRLQQEGAERVFDLVLEPQRDGDGNVVGITCAALDITARKRAEDLLQEQWELLQQVFATAAVGMCLADEQSRFIMVNPAFAKIFEYTPEEMVGMMARTLLPAAEHELMDATHRALLNGNESVRDWEVLTRHGTRRTIRVAAGRLLHKNDRRSILGVVEDITERKATEAVLTSEQRLLTAVLDQMPSGVIIAEAPSGRTLLANRRVAEIWGHPVSTVEGPAEHWLSRAFHQNGQAYEPQEWPTSRAITQGATVTGEEIDFLRADGTPGTMVASAAPVRDASGRIVAGVMVFDDVTALRQTQRQLLLHLEHSPLAVVEWDNQFRIKRWAGAAEALFGYSADEMVGRSIETVGIIHPDDVGQVAAVTAELRDVAPERLVSHNRNVSKSGRVLYCAWHNTVTRDRTGRLQSVLSLVLDETAECEAEAAAERSAEQLEQAQRAAKAGVWDAEISSGKVTWSAPYRELYGLAPDAEASSEGWIETIHPEDRKRVAVEVHRALETHAPLHLEFRIVRDGQVRWLETTGSTTYADDGHPLRISGITIDVTARKEAEAALAARSAELQALVTAAPVAIVALDRNGAIRDWSPAAEQLFGWRADEVLGRGLPFIPPDQSIVDTPSHAALERAESFHGTETEQLRKDGSRVPVAVWAAPLRGADGSVVGCLALFTDLTERRRQEQALREAQKLEAVGKLAGGMAHEVNNQLTAVLGFASFLARSLPQGDERQRDVQQIQRAAERAATVTRQVLAFSRQQLLQPIVVDLNALVQGLEPLVRRILGAEHNVTIETGSQPARVLADPTSLEVVVTSLALNARDAMPTAGQMMLTVDEIVVGHDEAIHKRHPELEPGPYVRLQVSDTGSGMTEAIRARAFEPFFTTKPIGDGTGLGLATVYGTVRQLGGVVEIDSAVGAGTTVCIFLPRVVTALPATPAPRPGSERGGGETVLVVDDEPGVREWLVRCLTEGGYRVIQAPDGPEALDQLADHGGAVRAVVTDVKMPRMSGRELAARIAQRWPGLPVLFISGFSGDELAERGLLDPGVPLLRKPFDSGALGAAVRGLLDSTPLKLAP